MMADREVPAGRTTHEIYVASTPNYHGYSYFEGMSGKLAVSDEGPSGWFCFEEPTALGRFYLTQLGFTAQQILEAPADEPEEDGDDPTDDGATAAYDAREDGENDGPAGDFLADYWFTAGGPDEPPE